MTRIIILTLLSLFAATKTSAQKNTTVDFPKVGLTINLSKSTFAATDDILIQMVVTNNYKTNQKMLFDKPKSSTGGPAHTTVALTNKKTGKSALKYGNKRVLESQGYSEEQLKDKYYNLSTGQSIKGVFNLFDMAVTTSENYRLYRLEKGALV